MSLTIYSTPTCPYCKMAKEFFKEKKVEYQDINVAENHDKAQEMIDKSGQMGVPVIVVPADMSSTGSEEVIIGFDRNRLSDLLKIEN